MLRFLVSSALFCAALLVCATAAFSQVTSLTGSSLAYKSLGGSSTTLSQTGYLGTYLVVPAGGATVNFDVNATGTGSAAHMAVVLANSNFGFNISGTSATDYDTPNVTLPAGTYFINAQRDYDNGVNNSFAVNNFKVNTVSGGTATFANDAMTTTAGSTDALNAANTYISNYREAPMNLTVQGVKAGTQITLSETNAAFKWGTAVPDSISTYIPSQPGNTATYTAMQTSYTNILNKDFNSVEPENAGKWSESDTSTQLASLDRLLNYASHFNMRVRMHNLIWGSQQPSDVNTDFNSNNTAAITSRLNSRIASYVGGTDTITGKPRATEFAQLDVYNESFHTGVNMATTSSPSQNDSYWQTMGATNTNGGAGWTAGLYNQVQSTVNSVGANTKLFTNEYNVLNSNSDNYGQWYQQHIESIRNGNGPNTGAVTGVGTEFYNTPGTTTSTGGAASQINSARTYATWANLAAQGLPLEVTEFGETAGTAANEATSLSTAMTLAFGTPQMTGFQVWGFLNYTNQYVGAVGSDLYNSSFQITAAGTAYEALHNSWTTNMTGTVNADGTVSLPGSAFYGDYQATINGKTYNFNFNPTTNSYTLSVPVVLGDFNGDGHLNMADVSAMMAALTNLPDFEATNGASYVESIGDINDDGVINNADLQALLNLLQSGGGSTNPVPEPATLALLALGGFILAYRKRLSLTAPAS